MVVALHEHRVQRPVEIVARADAGGAHRGERIEHRAGPDRNAGGAQRARKVDDVLGELALRVLHGELELGGLHHWKIGRLLTLENAPGVNTHFTIPVHKVVSVTNETADFGKFA